MHFDCKSSVHSIGCQSIRNCYDPSSRKTLESFGRFICGRSSVVERNLAKVDVEGSSPFARFSNSNPKHHASGFLLNSYYINPLSQTLLSDSFADFVA